MPQWRLRTLCVLVIFSLLRFCEAGRLDISNLRNATSEPGRKLQMAVIVSGLSTRVYAEAAQSLAEQVVQPQVEAGIDVFVFLVLQRGYSNKMGASVDSRTSEDEEKAIYKKALYSVGASHVLFAAYHQPDVATIMSKNGIMALEDDHVGSDGPERMERNMRMYHNIEQGYLVAQVFAASHLRRDVFDIYVRTRIDNVFFTRHPAYTKLSGLGDTVVAPACRKWHGVFDKFLIFYSHRAWQAFAFVLHHLYEDQATRILNSENTWLRALTKNKVEVKDEDPGTFSVANIASRIDGTDTGAGGRICYRSFEFCVTDPKLLEQLKGQDCGFRRA